MRKLESPPKGGGGGTGKPPGGHDPGGPKQPPGPTPTGMLAPEDAQAHTDRVLKSLLLRVGKLEEEMTVRDLPLAIPEVPVG